jgi:hypothetical protein
MAAPGRVRALPARELGVHGPQVGERPEQQDQHRPETTGPCALDETAGSDHRSHPEAPAGKGRQVPEGQERSRRQAEHEGESPCDPEPYATSGQDAKQRRERPGLGRGPEFSTRSKGGRPIAGRDPTERSAESRARAQKRNLG